MIFRSVKNIKDRKEKSFFIEKIKLFVNIVELYANYKNERLAKTKDQKLIINELASMGIISGNDELDSLKNFLPSDIYQKLLSSVSFFIKNKDEMLPLVYKFRNESRKQLQKKEVISDKFKVVDFFCGAGGMSLGFTKSGFRILLANDIVDECCETYKFNHPEIPSTNIVKDDIRLICNKMDDYVSEDTDVVIGGPPCQGFSSANRQRIIDDPRNELYKYFLKAVEVLSPKFVVMENVKGMLSVADQVVEDYRNISCKKHAKGENYMVAYKILNATDYGVAQNRERLIYIAIRNDISKKINIEPNDIFNKIEKISKKRRYVLKDALEYIKPLDSPREKNCTEVDSDIFGKKVDLNVFYKNSNSYLDLINSHKHKLFVFNHKARYASATNYKIFSLLKQGEDASASSIKGIMPYAHRLHCFKDKYYRLIESRPCKTITAHLKMDCLSHIHPTQNRTITPREAARIQSFPDDYVFLGAYLKTYMQIGNAVPVMLAETIAKVLKDILISCKDKI